MATELTAQQSNYINRQNLLANGIAMTKRIHPVQGGLGEQIRIPLDRVGICTGVVLQFKVPVTIATAPAVPSLCAPWNIANLVEYNDFTGVKRTRANGYQLWMAQSFKQGDAIGSIAQAAYSTGAGPTLNRDTNILNLPVAVGNSTIYFSLYVPLAYDAASDLTGAVLAQTNVGEHYINVQLPNALVSGDPLASPYASGDVTLTTGNKITVEAFQKYIAPQGASANNLPLVDLSTVYGFEGAYTTTANIASGQKTEINLPNNRTIFSSSVAFVNGGAFTANCADLNTFNLLVNGNTLLREQTPRLFREEMRNIGNFDAADGNFYFGFRKSPILTYLYGNVQLIGDVITANAGLTYFMTQHEVMYASGSPLPGITN